ncbi:DUF4041 domain-containing protein [Kineosporia succinea]|uniref:Myosin heavy subunit n=1 Tax=Kineosporia succinea TaxID=84632 RepID=A0ABT9P3P4_9ACTN|nr:DUF4041 domain-containing protein [Kineosporia succinea]MDP9827319.1 myosin heavy subunit [Kineosporia succinea]
MPPQQPIPFLGARQRARELQTALADLQEQDAQLRSLNTQLQDRVSDLEENLENTHRQAELLREHLIRLGAMDIIDLEERRRTLRSEIAQRFAEAQSEIQYQLDLSKKDLQTATESLAASREQLASLQERIVETEELTLLQEVGVYKYRHPLDDAVSYRSELSRLRDRVKAMTLKDGGAVSGAVGWILNDSEAQGRKMIGEASKLMLRAYNAEADNLVRSLKPYKLDSSVERLTKVMATIERLGKTMQIRISAQYHQLRVKELELTAAYIEKVAEEKERDKEEKARLREERKVQEEIERERARLIKEQQHYQNALSRLEQNGDTAAVQKLRDQLTEIGTAIESVDYRAANIRAGYVYVISNIGAFGPKVVKIGMTRRLDPMDRVRELGDASVPFRFDVHAVFFADDAVGIEGSLHSFFADRRVNQVNLRREFFYATPTEVRDRLLQLTGNLLTFEETPEAIEFRQSESTRQHVTV